MIRSRSPPSPGSLSGIAEGYRERIPVAARGESSRLVEAGKAQASPGHVRSIAASAPVWGAMTSVLMRDPPAGSSSVGARHRAWGRAFACRSRPPSRSVHRSRRLGARRGFTALGRHLYIGDSARCGFVPRSCHWQRSVTVTERSWRSANDDAHQHVRVSMQVTGSRATRARTNVPRPGRAAIPAPEDGQRSAVVQCHGDAEVEGKPWPTRMRRMSRTSWNFVTAS